RNPGEPVVISWPSTPGQSYQVQFKNNVEDSEWLQLPGNVVIINNTGSLQDLSPNAEHRIYRVVGL
ncbi:MAG: hypothetical protein M3Y82_15070, partial [Verrucomicrobiota bacterium]|nr:hypothetical protein [Verrucomicrobiota bacterium]